MKALHKMRLIEAFPRGQGKTTKQEVQVELLVKCFMFTLSRDHLNVVFCYLFLSWRGHRRVIFIHLFNFNYRPQNTT